MSNDEGSDCSCCHKRFNSVFLPNGPEGSEPAVAAAAEEEDETDEDEEGDEEVSICMETESGDG